MTEAPPRNQVKSSPRLTPSRAMVPSGRSGKRWWIVAITSVRNEPSGSTRRVGRTPNTSKVDWPFLAFRSSVPSPL